MIKSVNQMRVRLFLSKHPGEWISGQEISMATNLTIYQVSTMLRKMDGIDVSGSSSGRLYRLSEVIL